MHKLIFFLLIAHVAYSGKASTERDDETIRAEKELLRKLLKGEESSAPDIDVEHVGSSGGGGGGSIEGSFLEAHPDYEIYEYEGEEVVK